MKTLLTIAMTLASFSSFASNYPSDYCHARVTICEDGPGVVAHIHGGCNSSTVIGYKKSGILGHNSFVDAVVEYRFSNGMIARRDYRITPDWNHLGFITHEIKDISGNEMYIAFSNGSGAWDSRNNHNYYFPVGNSEAANYCYTVVTNDDYTTNIPLSAWDIINEAMKR